ncbi:hypothetical protein REPUB_Repub20aG0020000 [Reevesia pubescens]
MALQLPRFIVLRSNDKNDYVGYVHEDENYDGYLKFLEAQAESSYVKFEVEITGKDGLVHIRNCQNNKYLVISIDLEKKTIRIMYVQSGCYLCIWRLSNPAVARFVLANYKVYDGNSCDIFTIIDWESFLILPRYVAFKGNNDQYLCLREIDYHPYLQFATDDIGDLTVTMEIFPTNDGNVRIKPICSDAFWRRSPNWIWADSFDNSSNNKDTVFRPVKVDNQTIGLLNLGNNYFCKRLTTDGKTSCLNAAVPSVTKEAQLRVEEPVLTREIYSVDYNLDNSRLGAKTTFEASVPLIADAKVELFTEIQTGIEWGETKTSTTVLEVVHKVVVPKMTKVTAYLIATIGKCDVPFTFMQKDTLYNGTTVTTEVQGGTYIGSNYYNTDFQTKEEPLQN